MKLPKMLWVFAGTILLSGCTMEPDTVTPGIWRAVVTLPGGDLPFRIELDNADDGALKATLINGAERVAVPKISWDDGVLSLVFPAFNNRIELARKGSGFAGTLTLVKRGGVLQVMPITLTRDRSWRFFAGEQDVNADFAGKWSVDFVDEDAVITPAVGEFAQQNGVVSGTFRTPTGDYRYLAGQVRDRTLYLSTFDGAHAFLFVATQAEDGTVSGDFWSGTQWHETWRARRDVTAELTDPKVLSKMKAGVQSVEFAFPDTAGNLLRHDDSRFAGKVLIVAVAGSWCPNCHDEAAFLARFYERKKEHGLEVVGLMFEHLPVFADAAAQVDRFRDKFDIRYALLVAGYSDKQAATETLGMLDRVIAYPTMIVVDRRGVVRRVHTGFNGPGTGVHYETFRAQFETFIDGLLAEGDS